MTRRIFCTIALGMVAGCMSLEERLASRDPAVRADAVASIDKESELAALIDASTMTKGGDEIPRWSTDVRLAAYKKCKAEFGRQWALENFFPKSIIKRESGKSIVMRETVARYTADALLAVSNSTQVEIANMLRKSYESSRHINRALLWKNLSDMQIKCNLSAEIVSRAVDKGAIIPKGIDREIVKVLIDPENEEYANKAFAALKHPPKLLSELAFYKAFAERFDHITRLPDCDKELESDLERLLNIKYFRGQVPRAIGEFVAKFEHGNLRNKNDRSAWIAMFTKWVCPMMNENEVKLLADSLAKNGFNDVVGDILAVVDKAKFTTNAKVLLDSTGNRSDGGNTQKHETAVRWTEEAVAARLANPDAPIASTGQRLPPTRENISRLAEDIFGMRSGDLLTDSVIKTLQIQITRGRGEDHTHVFDGSETYAANHGANWKQKVHAIKPIVNTFAAKDTWIAVKKDVEMIVAFGATYIEQESFSPAIYAAIAKLVEERIDCSQVQKVCKEDKSYGIYKRAWLFPMGESKWRERNYIVFTLDGFKGRTTFRIDDFSLENISPGDMEKRTESGLMMHEQAKECGLSDSFLAIGAKVKMNSGKNIKPTSLPRQEEKEESLSALVLEGRQDSKGRMVAHDNGTTFIYHRLPRGNQIDALSGETGASIGKFGPYEEDGVCITFCERSDWHNYTGEIVFPSQIDNLPVLFIGQGTEEYNGFSPDGIFASIDGKKEARNRSESHVLSLYFPEGVVEIGRIGRPRWHDDFHSKPSVKVILPKSLKRIGGRAFRDVVGGLSMRLPDGLKQIGKEAFFGSDLKSINIPESVESFGYECFGALPNLVNIELPENPWFNIGRILSETGWWKNLIAEGEIKYGNRIIKYNGAVPSNLIISDGTTGIDADVFSNRNELFSVRFPETIRFIGKQAFSSCKNLREIVLPDVEGLTIEDGAFEKCHSLRELPVFKHAKIGKNALPVCKSSRIESFCGIKFGEPMGRGILGNDRDESFQKRTIELKHPIKGITEATVYGGVKTGRICRIQLYKEYSSGLNSAPGDAKEFADMFERKYGVERHGEGVKIFGGFSLTGWSTCYEFKLENGSIEISYNSVAHRLVIEVSQNEAMSAAKAEESAESDMDIL